MKVLLLACRDYAIYNQRFELVQKLIDDRNEVVICLPYGPKVDLLTSIGARFIPIKINGHGTNPFAEFLLVQDLKRIFTAEKPDIILMYTTKADIYGGIVAGKLGIPYLLNISGIGTAAGKHGMLQKVVMGLYKVAFKKANCVFFQSKENMEFFHNFGIYGTKERLIPGSGVNIEKYEYLNYPSEEGGIHFLFISRIIKEKGIEEYLETAKAVKKLYPNTFFHVIGPCDGDYKDRLWDCLNKGYISYHGTVDDTKEYIRSSHCFVFPSYYPEGISNVCLEAAACGRPVITTDNPGCVDTVLDGETGYIVPVEDANAIKEAVIRFVELPFVIKKKMGIQGRELVREKFDRSIVIDAYEVELKAFE